MDFWELQINVFFFNLHFKKGPNFLGIWSLYNTNDEIPVAVGNSSGLHCRAPTKTTKKNFHLAFVFLIIFINR